MRPWVRVYALIRHSASSAAPPKLHEQFHARASAWPYDTIFDGDLHAATGPSASSRRCSRALSKEGRDEASEAWYLGRHIGLIYIAISTSEEQAHFEMREKAADKANMPGARYVSWSLHHYYFSALSTLTRFIGEAISRYLNYHEERRCRMAIKIPLDDTPVLKPPLISMLSMLEHARSLFTFCFISFDVFPAITDMEASRTAKGLCQRQYLK